MTGTEAKSVLEEAIARLFARQPNIFDFTSETGQTEWNLVHHLAVELREFFPDLDEDLDVVKREYENRRPDIILHKRGSHDSNYLVIEVKRDGCASELDADVRKIHDHWFREPLCYHFGAVVNLRTDRPHEVNVFENTSNCIGGES